MCYINIESNDYMEFSSTESFSRLGFLLPTLLLLC